MGDKVRVYPNEDRKLEDVIFIGEFIRDLPPSRAGKCEVKVDELLRPEVDPGLKIGTVVEVDEIRLDFIGVEPGKP